MKDGSTGPEPISRKLRRATGSRETAGPVEGWRCHTGWSGSALDLDSCPYQQAAGWPSRAAGMAGFALRAP
jgi:hypothetical protein